MRPGVKLAKAYEVLTDREVGRLIDENHWAEICHGNEA
jgi:hypothetical protein